VELAEKLDVALTADQFSPQYSAGNAAFVHTKKKTNTKINKVVIWHCLEFENYEPR